MTPVAKTEKRMYKITISLINNTQLTLSHFCVYQCSLPFIET